MDTRFWGPSGWHLLHLIAQTPVRTACHATAILRWIELLEFILPCKYCRASFHQYIRLQPLTLKIIMDEVAFGRWMYDMHNRVNGKLRGQGLLTTSDPSWASVRARYERMVTQVCKGLPLIGWDFMTSVAYSTPTEAYKPVAMPDTPDNLSRHTDVATRNRYNLLSRAERLRYLKQWWELIPSILPCAQWRAAWAGAMRSAEPPPLKQGVAAVMRWMWKIEEGVCADLQCPTPHASGSALHEEVSSYESGCGRMKRGKTCRARRKKQWRRARTHRTHGGTVHVL